MVTVFWGILILCTPVFASAGATGAGGSVCPSVVYLKNGIGGQIPCLCGPFTIVAWYREEEFNGGGSPIINYDKVQKRGQGFSSGEYDIAENGSLVITNVTRNHDGVFVVTVADDSQHREDQIRIRVIVVVPAVPVYPVVNGKVNQQHVCLGVNRKGVLTCAMSDVYPAFNLTFKSHSDKIKFEHQNMSKMLQQNNKYDVTLSTIYTVTDLSIERLTIFCEVADDEIADQFADKTTAILVLEPVYPVVNGYTNQEHVYLDKIDRVGQLNCMKQKVPVGTSLTWEVADSSLQGRVSIESFPAMSDNNDGTVDITQTVNYTVDNSVNRIPLLCKVVQPNTEQLLATKVDLLFENVYPVVNGHFSQNHVYLDVDREGHLTCVKESVDAGTRLVWEIVDQNGDNKINFRSAEFKTTNDDGTVNINQTFDYAIHDLFMVRLTLNCRVLVRDTDEHAVATRVDLLFQSAAGTKQNSSHDTNLVIAITVMFLLIFSLQLIDIIFSYCNRKMFKNSEVKYLAALGTVDRHTDNGHVEMVWTRNTDLAERGSSLSFGSNVQNGEQHAFLDGGCPNTKEQDPSDVNQRTFGDAQVV